PHMPRSKTEDGRSDEARLLAVVARGSHDAIVALEPHAERATRIQIDAAARLIREIGDGVLDAKYRRAGARASEQHLRKRIDAGACGSPEPRSTHERVDAHLRFVSGDRQRLHAASDLTD